MYEISVRSTPPPSSLLPTHSSQVVSRMAQEQQGEDDIEMQEIREERSGSNFHTTDALSFEFPTIKKVLNKSRAAIHDSASYYKPCHVSIGPRHRCSSNLLREAKKREWLGRLKAAANKRPEVQHGSESSGTTEGAQDLDDEALVKEISAQLNSAPATRYYDHADGSWNGTGEDLARVLLLDGCYLIAQYADVMKTLQQHKNAHASRSSQGQGQGQGGPSKKLRQISAEFLCSGICSSGSSSEQQKEEEEHTRAGSDEQVNNALMVRDTWFILENQIPFFVLEQIFKRVIGCAAAEVIVRRNFTNRAHDLLNIQRMCISRNHPAASKLLDETPTYHLLHLLHKLLKPHNKPESESQAKSRSKMRNGDRRAAERQWHRATDYRMYANVDFKGRDIIEDNNHSAAADVLSVLDVRIEGRNVVIPCLRVDGDTWTILLNLMALEGQHPWLGTYVTAYCLFMSQIACTKEDVELLEAKGVIDRHLSTPESVAADFSKLCYGVVFDKNDPAANYLKPLWHHLDKRYTSRRQNAIAWLRLNYLTCRNVSVLLGVFSAIILLGAGVLSAVYQVLSYYHPQNIAPAPPHGH